MIMSRYRYNVTMTPRKLLLTNVTDHLPLLLNVTDRNPNVTVTSVTFIFF